jgi:hypothetical protein
MVGLVADDVEFKRRKREYAACVENCQELGRRKANQATKPQEFDPDVYLCLKSDGRFVPDGQTWGDGCSRAPSSEYDLIGVAIAAVIGFFWAPPVAWLLILAMIKSVVRTVKDASK